MLDAMEGQAKSLDEFGSPMRVLAAFFQKSRDKWKQRCMDAKKELKRFKVRVHDVSKSRDAWREQAKSKQRELESLQSQVQQLEHQLSEVSSEASAAEPQKMTLPPPAVSSLCQPSER